MVVNLSEWRSFIRKVEILLKVKKILLKVKPKGNGELFNASFFLKAQDHFRATKPGAGMNRFFWSKS